MIQKILTIPIIFFSCFVVLFSFFAPVAQAADTPTWINPFDNLQISIPGLDKFSDPVNCGTDSGRVQYCLKWIGEYITAVYKYAVGVVGIISAVVFMFGGMLYLTAGGDSSRIGEAKSWIVASLTGLVLVLSSYMIIYQVNPNLTGLKNGIKVSVITGETTTSTTDTCEKYGTKGVIDYNTSEELSLPSGCANYDSTFSEVASSAIYGVDAKILKSIAAQESTCTASAGSSAGACGLMQLLPSTAQKYDSNATCDWLKSHPEESIKIAARYIKSSGQINKEKIFAGYNSGYGSSSSSGKKGALASSSDCPGYLAYQCCINPGELAETQDYVFKTMKYYNSQ